MGKWIVNSAEALNMQLLFDEKYEAHFSFSLTEDDGADGIGPHQEPAELCVSAPLVRQAKSGQSC